MTDLPMYVHSQAGALLRCPVFSGAGAEFAEWETELKAERKSLELKL